MEKKIINNNESNNNESKDVKKPNYIKLQHVNLIYRTNESKGVVTAIETFHIPIFNYTFRTVGVATVDESKNDIFDLETGKKIARAKAEKEAFSRFKGILKEYIKRLNENIYNLNATIDRTEGFIEHQKEYIATF